MSPKSFHFSFIILLFIYLFAFYCSSDTDPLPPVEHPEILFAPTTNRSPGSSPVLDGRF
ncbi:hypothetical protein BJX96DRAFT_159522 [Aspergillus floccosus]